MEKPIIYLELSSNCEHYFLQYARYEDIRQQNYVTQMVEHFWPRAEGEYIFTLPVKDLPYFELLSEMHNLTVTVEDM